MSGTTGIPRATKTSSASGQVGPLAASMMALACDGLGHARVEDSAQRGGDQHVDRHGQELLVGAGVAPLEADDLVVTATCRSSAGMSIPSRMSDGAIGVGDGEDLAPLSEEAGRVAADIAVTLDREGRAGDRPLEPREQLAGDERQAEARGGLAARRAVELDGLAGDAGRVEAVELGVLVHDPRHHLGVGAHVGGGDVLVGADEVMDLLDELARQTLELAARELARDHS